GHREARADRCPSPGGCTGGRPPRGGAEPPHGGRALARRREAGGRRACAGGTRGLPSGPRCRARGGGGRKLPIIAAHMPRYGPPDAFVTPRFSGPRTFMRLPHVTDL